MLALGMAGPVLAQSKSPTDGFKHDKSAKIEVTADSLQVDQSQKLAIFEGEVVAGQDTMRLTTDKLAVTYASQGRDQIQHMRADGNVFLVNGNSTAKGSWAEYDVAGGLINMGGEVVVTMGDIVIASPSMQIDLNTGLAQATGGRVTSIVTPAKKN